jgi:hypothetical protein
MVLGSENSFFLSHEIKDPDKNTEGTVPVPPDRLCAERDEDVLPFHEQSHLGGVQSDGNEKPVNVQIFF